MQGGNIMMGGGLLVWVIIGVVLYILLSKRGGMTGCCGGHGNHPYNGDGYHGHGQNSPHQHQPKGDIIDLKKEDYHVS